jgi:hypothetical protein
MHREKFLEEKQKVKKWDEIDFYSSSGFPRLISLVNAP